MLNHYNDLEIQKSSFCGTGLANSTTSLQNSSTTTCIPIGVYTKYNNLGTVTSAGGVTIPKGTYLISAACYITSSSITGRVSRGVFVKDSSASSGNEILASIEHQNATNAQVMGAVAAAAKLVTIDSSKTLYLHARCVGTTATVDNDNISTYLSILRIR